MTVWLGVVSAAHVRRAVELGIAQINHGKRPGLARMSPADTLIFYSPTERLGDRTPLQQFTALGTIADGEIWQADEGDFQPFRRRVHWVESLPAALTDLREHLHLTSAPNWGYSLRRGLVELDEHDFSLIEAAMRR